MLGEYDNLWLDTTMVFADYPPGNHPPRLADLRVDRIMFGTDFPNIPYAWDREIKSFLDMELSNDALSSFSEKTQRIFMEYKGWSRACSLSELSEKVATHDPIHPSILVMRSEVRLRDAPA